MPAPVYKQETNVGQVRDNAPNATRGVSIAPIAQYFGDRDDEARAQLERAQRASDDIWAATAVSTLQRSLMGVEQQLNVSPSEDAEKIAFKEYESRANKLTMDAPSDYARSKFELASLEISNAVKQFGMNNALKAKTNKTLLQLAEQTTAIREVAANPDIDAANPNLIYKMVQESKAIIDMGVGSLYDEMTAAKMKLDADSAMLETVDLWTVKNTDKAEQLLRMIPNLSGSVRADKEAKIANARKSLDDISKISIRQQAKDYEARVREFGVDGAGTFDREAYLSTYDEVDRVAMADQLDREVELNNGIHSFTSITAGMPLSDIDKEVEKLRPDPTTGTEQQLKLYAAAQTLRANAEAAIKDDPAAYAMRDPVIMELRSAWASLPEDDEWKQQAFGEYVKNLVNKQLSYGIAPGSVRVIDKDESIRLADALNNSSTQFKLNGIKELKSQYGDYFPDLMRGLQAMPSGQRVDPTLSLLHDFIDDDTDQNGWVFNAIEAQKRTAKGEGFSTKEFNDIEDSVYTELNKKVFKTLENSAARSEFDSSNISEMKEGIASSVSQYALYLRTQGHSSSEAAKLAVSQYFSNVNFVKANDKDVSIPTKIGNWRVTPDQVKNIQFAMESMLALDPSLTPFGPDFLEKLGSPKYREKNDFSRIPNESTVFRLRMDEDGTAPVLMQTIAGTDRMMEFISENAYFAENSTNDGVVLMATTNAGRKNPIVDDKGNPIEFKFADLNTWAASQQGLSSEFAKGAYGPLPSGNLMFTPRPTPPNVKGTLKQQSKRIREEKRNPKTPGVQGPAAAVAETLVYPIKALSNNIF